MKFNVVIGNPPYNRGMDVDFILAGQEMSKDYCVMVTPAKWQSAEADQSIMSNHSYGEVREKVVPCMEKVVFYPCCKDVFNIYQVDGITYFIVGQEPVDSCTMVNKCRDIKEFNSTVYRDITHGESLLNIGNEIIQYLGNYEPFHFNPYYKTNRGEHRYELLVNTKVGGYDWFSTETPRYVLSISRILDTQAGESYGGESQCVYSSDNKSECESFNSWLYSRFVRFFVMTNISKLNNVLTDHVFKFVPAPPRDVNGDYKWDHIYTDEELYKYYNLPQRYINVINALIKSRE